MNSQWAGNTDARLACARYVFASALTWPIRTCYLVFTLSALAIHVVATTFFPMLITQGGKLLLSCRRCARF